MSRGPSGDHRLCVPADCRPYACRPMITGFLSNCITVSEYHAVLTGTSTPLRFRFVPAFGGGTPFSVSRLAIAQPPSPFSACSIIQSHTRIFSQYLGLIRTRQPG